MGFADPQLPSILHTDASTIGLGAALYQLQDGQLRVIAFAIQGLSKSKMKYPAHKLEFLALKWTVIEKFSDFLCSTDFTMVTDSNPLACVLISAKLCDELQVAVHPFHLFLPTPESASKT